MSPVTNISQIATSLENIKREFEQSLEKLNTPAHVLTRRKSNSLKKKKVTILDSPILSNEGTTTTSFIDEKNTFQNNLKPSSVPTSLFDCFMFLNGESVVTFTNGQGKCFYLESQTAVRIYALPSDPSYLKK
jgi:DNA-binding transcriptional regulator WhiA